jgi:monoamine oxidase
MPARLEISRRRLLGGSAAAAIAAALPPRAGARTRRPARRADVIVVGAGLAGLAAARGLAAAGRSVLVLEARDRVGGRTRTIDAGGTFIDLGGQWVGPTQSRVVALAKAVGVRTFDVYAQGDRLLRLGGGLRRFQETPPLSEAGVSALASAYAQLEAMAGEIDVDAPWRSPNAAVWDSMTMETWLAATVADAGARSFLTLDTRASAAVEPSDISLLAVLAALASGPTDEDPEAWRFVGGAQPIARRVAARLGERVVLNAPVARVVRRARGVVVEAAGRRYVGDAAVVAVPLALASRIAYEPPLPAARDQFSQRAPMASVIKCQAVYRAPFWRDEGLTGYALSDAGPVVQTADSSPPAGRPGVLVGFVAGNQARRWVQRSKGARRAAVLAAFAQLFGKRAGSPLAYFEGNWPAEPWTRGCYSTVFPPGVLTEFGPALRRPVGAIHWAGTETASRWTHFMDGAVRSGERVAAELT